MSRTTPSSTSSHALSHTCGSFLPATLPCSRFLIRCFVACSDDGAITSIQQYYSSLMKDGDSVCDLCSSWISHLPTDVKFSRVAGLGMNKDELARNGQLTEYVVQDLNQQPALPYDDESFDFVCNVVSVDYLNKPLEIFREMHRILRPGGKAIMSFSNRCFPTVR